MGFSNFQRVVFPAGSLVTPGIPTTPEPLDYALRFQFDEGAGGLTQDDVTGLLGTFVHSVTWSDGRLHGTGHGISPDADAYVSVPTDTNLHTADMSFSTWVYPGAFPATSGDTYKYHFLASVERPTKTHNLEFFITRAGVYGATIYPTLCVNLGDTIAYAELPDMVLSAWDQYAFSFTGDDPSTIKLYFNGLPLSVSYTSSDRTSIVGAGMRIGNSYGADLAAYAPGIQGWMDDFRIYHRELSAAEFAAMVPNSLTTLTIDAAVGPSDYTHRWLMDEAAGSTQLVDIPGGFHVDKRGSATEGNVVTDRIGGTSVAAYVPWDFASRFDFLTSNLSATDITICGWFNLAHECRSTNHLFMKFHHAGIGNSVEVYLINASNFLHPGDANYYPQPYNYELATFQRGAGRLASMQFVAKAHEWHHFTLTMSADGSAYQLYIDGVPGAMGVYPGTASGGSDLTGVSIGNDYPQTTNFFGANAYLKDFRVYDRILSDSEIFSHIA